MDLFSHPSFEKHFRTLAETNSPVFSEMMDPGYLLNGQTSEIESNEHSFIMQPLYSDFSTPAAEQTLVGFVVGVLSWKDMLRQLPHPRKKKVFVVLHSNCGDLVTYETDGYKTMLVGMGDAHNSAFDHLEVSEDITEFLGKSISHVSAQCAYGVRIYPTDSFRDQSFSGAPLLYAALAVLLFGFTTGTSLQQNCTQSMGFQRLNGCSFSVVFGVYDFIVQRRQRHVIDEAERATKIVSELFPRNVKDRLLAKKDYNDNASSDGFEGDHDMGLGAVSAHTRGSILTENSSKVKSKGMGPYETKPIADLFVSFVLACQCFMEYKSMVPHRHYVTPCLLFTIHSQMQQW